MNKDTKLHGKSLARLIAVQGLYSAAVSGEEDVESITSRLLHVELENDDGSDGRIDQSPDKKLLKDLIKGCTDKKDEIDGIIKKYLKEGWDISRVDSLLLAIIRPAVFELSHHKKTPVKVIFDEYINIAHAFYELQEVGFINAILDSVAHDLRPDEVK